MNNEIYHSVVIARKTTDDLTKGGIYYIKSVSENLNYVITNEIGSKIELDPIGSDDFVVLFNVTTSEINKIRNIII